MDRARYLNIRKSLDLGHRPWAMTRHLFTDLALGGLGFAIWSFASPYGLGFLTAPVFSAMIFRNLSLMHEAVHGTAFQKKSVNDLIGLISGAFCFLPFETWKKGHLEHHYWTGNIEKDPVMAILIAFPKFSKRTQNFIDFFWNRWFPVLTIIQTIVFWNISLRIFRREKKTARMFASLTLPLMLWGCVFAFCPAAFVLTAVVPSIIAYMLMVEVVNFPHHLQLPQYGGDQKFPVWEQHQTARSCVYPTWFARLVVLNFNYHTEHHLFPEVPWYRLDRLHAELAKELGDRHNVDPYFKWILENKPKPLIEVLGEPQAAKAAKQAA